MSDKIGYAAGDIGNNFTFFLVRSFLMLFYTDVWGIEPKTVGTLFVVSRIVDAYTDVGMGTIVDRFAGNKDGKYRPFIKCEAIPFTFPKGEEVIAVDDDGICISPNDVPGYDKDKYMPEGMTYAYKDECGNEYKLGFSLSY